MLDVVRWYSWHFTVRGVQNQQYKVALHTPDVTVRLYHADFAQSVTLPIGPQEGNKWWFAPSRISTNMLIIYVSGAGLDVPRYYTFLSDVLDHSTRYVMAVLLRLFEILPQASVARHVWWSDVGVHFRSARFFYFWLVHMAKEWKTPTELNYFAEGHGKGIIDGHAGRNRRWLEQAARTKTISSCEDMAACLQERADQQAKRSPGRAICHYVTFNPPAISELPQDTFDASVLRKAGLGVRSTYALSSEVDIAGQVKVASHSLTGMSATCEAVPPAADRKGKTAKPASTCLRSSAADACEGDVEEDEAHVELGKPGTDGWRRTYRTQEPEKGWALNCHLLNCHF